MELASNSVKVVLNYSKTYFSLYITIYKDQRGYIFFVYF